MRRTFKQPARGGAPLFVQLADAVIGDIRGGVLRAGDRLPSTRELARQLALNRNTVVAAFDELVAQGWIITAGAAGTRIADEVPEPRAPRAPKASPRATTVGFDLREVPALRGPAGAASARYQLSTGVPDTRLVPRVALSRAYRRALRTTSLDYGDPRGTLRLRSAIAAMLRESRGMAVGPDEILVTRGSQMALDLVARVLVGRGDTIAVEELGYHPAWRAFEEAGARLVPVPLDAAGLVVDALPKGAARAVYVTPHHQYPTTVLMSPARRHALLAVAAARRLAVIEDDYDHEFHFDGRPVAPLAAHDGGKHVAYVGTLSKILAPGLRLGYVAAAAPMIDALAGLRVTLDRQGDHVLEHAVAELVEDGVLARHARTMRRIYARRRDALASVVERELTGAVTVTLPPGGLTLWARVDDAIDLDRWRARALELGVAFATGRDFDLRRRPLPFIRLVFGHHDETELVDAIRLLRRALPKRATARAS